MIGAIIGDMVGSLYDGQEPKETQVRLYKNGARMTDDSILTVATIKILIKYRNSLFDEKEKANIQKDLVETYSLSYLRHPLAGWGDMFRKWALTKDKKPYHSYGNGSAMRVSPVGWVCNNLDEVKYLSRLVSEITHDHPEGIKGAEAIAAAIFLARKGSSKEQIKQYIIENYYPEAATLSFDDLVKNYSFNATCQNSVPQAIYCFLISKDEEDALKNCILIGGDTDTIGCMCGAISEAYYANEYLSKFEDEYLYWMVDPDVVDLLRRFYGLFGFKKFMKQANN